MAYNTNDERLLASMDKRARIGACGTILIDDTTTEHAGPFVAFTALSESTVDVSECTTNIEDAVDFAVPAGVTVFGEFDSLQFVTAALVIAYYKCD